MTLWWQQDQKEAAGVVDSCPLSAMCAVVCLTGGRGKRLGKQSRGGSMPSTIAVAPGFFPALFS